MENSFDNVPKQEESEKQEKSVYTDPNADVSEDNINTVRNDTTYQYQTNEEYNTRSGSDYTRAYDKGMDTSPMSMSDWLLTLLVMLIPCGFILYIYWAFSNTGNINRRNFSRAYLIITAVSILLALILFMVFGTLAMGLFATSANLIY